MRFTFGTAPGVLCEPGAASRLGPLVGARVGSVVQLVTDPGLVRAGLVEPAVRSLRSVGLQVHVFEDVVADPSTAVVTAAVAQALAQRVEGVIGLGGGSSMDVAKLVALLAGSGERLEEVFGVGAARGRRLPLVQVPTTAGTGSEVTPIAIVTVDESEKRGVVAPQLLPDIAVLDAELTLGLPAHVTAATGIDAMVHAIEAYTSASANNNPVSRALSREALRLLGAHIRTVVADGRDVRARSAMLLGSMLAGQAFANSPVAAVHALAYPIGGLFHVPHGLSNALVLPHVLSFNLPACADAYATLATDAFEDLAGLPAVARAERFVERMADLGAALGLQRRLREVDIPIGEIDRMAADAMRQTRLLVNNPRPLSEEDARAIYRAAW